MRNLVVTIRRHEALREKYKVNLNMHANFNLMVAYKDLTNSNIFLIVILIWIFKFLPIAKLSYNTTVQHKLSTQLKICNCNNKTPQNERH